ncbi:MAG: AAA family ATPase [Spirochaetaceae bacterium]|nr:AAA family ATPase [Spirochaetaceae bacterium]MCF7947197.1 AAA family ATPase [Spirochaetia bacterium]MCF7950062.1 AAA family ATPase [Spirochaetaceae bacterium]
MLGGEGFYHGTSILVSGTAGTGKTSLCGHIADAACRRGEKVLYLSFEESGTQVKRNLSSIGLDLSSWEQSGLLKFHSERVSIYGLESHLTMLHRLTSEYRPSVVIIDPINAYLSNENELEVKSMLTRLIDFLKAKPVTGYFTALTSGTLAEAGTDVGISSLMDSWLLLRDIEENGERNRGLYVLKSRGIANSNQIREFLITSHGVQLKEVYLGTEGILTGSARYVQEQIDEEETEMLKTRIDRLKNTLQRKKKAAESQIELTQIQMKADEIETQNEIDELTRQFEQTQLRRQGMLESKKGIGE